MRNNTKNGNQRFIPHSNVFHWFPMYFSDRRTTRHYRRNSPLKFADPSPARPTAPFHCLPTPLLHLTTSTFISSTDHFHNSPPAFLSPFPPPSRFHFPDSPPSFPSVGYTTCIPPKRLPRKIHSRFLHPSRFPHTYCLKQKKKKDCFLSKAVLFGVAPRGIEPLFQE